jgi:hypothetical protein
MNAAQGEGVVLRSAAEKRRDKAPSERQAIGPRRDEEDRRRGRRCGS